MTGGLPSLLDESGFLADLARVDLPKPEDAIGDARPVVDGLERLDTGLIYDPAQSARLNRPMPMVLPTASDDGVSGAYSVPSTTSRRLRRVAAYLLLMALGGAAAVVVFHDRVSQIVMMWSASDSQTADPSTR